MKHVRIDSFDIPSAWFKMLKAIWFEGEVFNVGYGSELSETKKLSVDLQIFHPEVRPLVDGKCITTDVNHIQDYMLNYLFIDDCYDFDYTYGQRMKKPVNQIDSVIDRFKENMYDRQCVIVIRRPEDVLKSSIESPPCLIYLSYEVLHNKLHCEGAFRSWDTYAGLPENLGGLQLLNEYISGEIGIKTGKMIFHCKNAHIYSRCYDLVKDLFKGDNDVKRLAKHLNINKT